MKRTIVFAMAILLANCALSQNRRTIFYDSLGKETTFELHWSQVVTGRYKTIYDRKANKRTLARTTEEEFNNELRKTENRITETDKVGKPFPAFALKDLNGNAITLASLMGKVVVVNFWFIGCGPCEMERPALNSLVNSYSTNPDVVFLSFAWNDPEKLKAYLKENPLLYSIIQADKKYLANTFGVKAFPANFVLSREGTYAYCSSATGIGIATILSREIDKALGQPALSK